MIFLFRKSNTDVVIRLSLSEIPIQNFSKNIKHDIVHILCGTLGTARYMMFIWFPDKPVL